MRSSATLRVGTVITRLEGGAGQHALRGALSLDPACYPGETGLLVPPGRPHLMADAVRYLLDSPEASARMATGARAPVRETVRREGAAPGPHRGVLRRGCHGLATTWLTVRNAFIQ